MAQGILLDSSVVIEHLRGRLDIAERAIAAEPLFLPLVALGELYKGCSSLGILSKTESVSKPFCKRSPSFILMPPRQSIMLV